MDTSEKTLANKYPNHQQNCNRRAHTVGRTIYALGPTTGGHHSYQNKRNQTQKNNIPHIPTWKGNSIPTYPHNHTPPPKNIPPPKDNKPIHPTTKTPPNPPTNHNYNLYNPPTTPHTQQYHPQQITFLFTPHLYPTTTHTTRILQPLQPPPHNPILPPPCSAYHLTSRWSGRLRAARSGAAQRRVRRIGRRCVMQRAYRLVPGLDPLLWHS